MPNDSGTPDGRNWDAILAAFSRSGAGRPAEPSDWGVPGPGPSSQTEASPAPSTDLLAHFTHQLLLQQQQQLQAYSGYPPEYVALLQASNQALQVQQLQQLSLSNLAPTPTGRPPPNTSPIADPSGGLSTAALTPAGLDDTEDKRVRNTLASARFRAKKKAHVENVERNIRALEAQHSELEVQVADLRKENGLLKEMVQLKYGGVKNG
ncbi:hypothetical protein CcaverHIS631_0101410 [Cutaneotrichosporon cavernicola]|nr:hypothetical protein CcaverHIS631_0101410 [Cutaneotrichosporon cavernicola]